MRHIGHVGGALVLITIAVSTLDEPAAFRFTAIAVLASLLPDIDKHLPYVLHQGVIHTYSIMFFVSIVSGLIAAGVAAAITSREYFGIEKILKSPKKAFVLTTSAMILGTFSHVTLDVVAYRESFTSMPVEPLWPFTDWVPRINVFPPHAPMWNYGFLLVGIILWLVVFWAKRWRRERESVEWL